MVQTVLLFGALLWLVIVASIPTTTAVENLDTPATPGDRERCPVCGMFVAPYPEWVAQVRHTDGTTVFFDGCKDLFKYLLLLDEKAPDRNRKSVASVFVTNYYDGEVIAARTAHFVPGSDVMGPMGPELVPHRSVRAAADFMKDHKGWAILRFDEVTEAVLRELQ